MIDSYIIVMRKPVFGVSARPDINRAVQQLKMARDLKCWILEVEGLYYLHSEKTKVQISCAVTAYAKSRFSHGMAHVITHLGPVVQSIISLTVLLRCQLVKYMPTTLLNTLLFFVEKM